MSLKSTFLFLTKYPPNYVWSLAESLFQIWSTGRVYKFLCTDCQQKSRSVQIFCHSRINQATSLKFSGPLQHSMEQLTYTFYIYISNGIDVIPHFVTYPDLLHTNHETCILTRLASILRNGYVITNNLDPRTWPCCMANEIWYALLLGRSLMIGWRKKILKPWKGAHCSHSVCVSVSPCVRV